MLVTGHNLSYWQGTDCFSRAERDLIAIDPEEKLCLTKAMFQTLFVCDARAHSCVLFTFSNRDVGIPLFDASSGMSFA